MLILSFCLHGYPKFKIGPPPGGLTRICGGPMGPPMGPMGPQGPPQGLRGGPWVPTSPPMASGGPMGPQGPMGPLGPPWDPMGPPWGPRVIFVTTREKVENVILLKFRIPKLWAWPTFRQVTASTRLRQEQGCLRWPLAWIPSKLIGIYSIYKNLK